MNLTNDLLNNLTESGNSAAIASYYLGEISKQKEYPVQMKLRHYQESIGKIQADIMKLKGEINNDKDLQS